MGRTRRPHAAAWALVLLLPTLASCGTFPVSLFVRPETIERLDESDYLETTERRSRERALAALFDGPTAPVPAPRRSALYRHALPAEAIAEDAAQARADRPEALDDPSHPHLAGLRPGDLLLAKNHKPQSLGQTLSLADFVYHDHLGVLGRAEGRYVVYESWPRLSFLHRAPDFAARFRGGVRRSSLAAFLGRYETFEFVRLVPESLGPALVVAAEASLEHPVAYDPYHDPGDPRLSCSEYLEALLLAVSSTPPALERVPATRNGGVRRLMESLGFRTHPYLVPESFLALPGARLVARLSRHEDEADLRGERLGFALLHELSEAGAAPGSFLALHPWRLLRYRHCVSDFLDFARGRARVTPPERLEHDLRLALPFFLRRRER